MKVLEEFNVSLKAEKAPELQELIQKQLGRVDDDDQFACLCTIRLYGNTLEISGAFYDFEAGLKIKKIVAEIAANEPAKDPA